MTSIAYKHIGTSSNFMSQAKKWRVYGLSGRACAVLALTNCTTAEQVAQLGRAYFEGRANVGPRTLNELAKFAGWPPKINSALDAIAATLALSLPDSEDPREVANDTIIGLRRAGFLISVRRSPKPPQIKGSGERQ